MQSASELVRELRVTSGLSQSALAIRAGCTRSTVVRIEAGQIDATLTMLSRLATAAGRRIAIEASTPQGTTLATIAASTKSIDKIDWTRLRGLVDSLQDSPDDLMPAITDPPARTGDAASDNLFAAIAEKIADDAGIARPRWTRTLAPLSTPWSPPGTPRMRAAEEAGAAPQFRERNLLLGQENLWRNAA